jgi:hypothetical protein
MHVYLTDGESVRAVPAPAQRPLRCAAWRPDGALALLAGNRGDAFAFDGAAFARVDTGTKDNLRGVGWAPDGSRALLAGNRGAVLLFDGRRCQPLSPVTSENLRRVEWAPDGSCALVIGNAGVVLRYDAATGALAPLPGDRAHTMRAIAWRPDGAYALIGAYASRHAGYPRPHVLYRCDGRYTQALLATDDEDDCVALSWRHGAVPPRALALVLAYEALPGGGERITNKLIQYDGSGFASAAVEAPGALLGAAWRPDGAWALLCGESGALFRHDGAAIAAVATGTHDNLVGPFWRPRDPVALLLKGPDEKVFTV